MARVKISKNLINSIANQDNKNYFEKTSNKIEEIVSASIEELADKVSYVTSNNVVFQPVNELFSGAFCDNSKFIYFLGIENAQLTLNTAKKSNFWKQIWNKLKFAWANRRKRKKNKKKNKDNEGEINVSTKDLAKYSIYDLASDFQTALVNQLTETSLIYLGGNEITILGKEDLGANVKVVIYIVNYECDEYKFYAGRRKGFINVDVASRGRCLNEKIDKCGENFIKIIKIFNVLYFNANGSLPNQLFIESIIYNIPDDLFVGDDIYNVFVKVINYLSIKTIKNVKSINDESKTIFTDIVCGNDAFGFTKMMEFVVEN